MGGANDGATPREIPRNDGVLVALTSLFPTTPVRPGHTPLASLRLLAPLSLCERGVPSPYNEALYFSQSSTVNPGFEK